MIAKTYEGFFNFWKKQPKSKEVSLYEIEELFLDIQDLGLIVKVNRHNSAKQISITISKFEDWIRWINNGSFLITDDIKNTIGFAIDYIANEFNWKFHNIQLDYQWDPMREAEGKTKKIYKDFNLVNSLTGPKLNVYGIRIRFNKID